MPYLGSAVHVCGCAYIHNTIPFRLVSYRRIERNIQELDEDQRDLHKQLPSTECKSSDIVFMKIKHYYILLEIPL